MSVNINVVVKTLLIESETEINTPETETEAFSVRDQTDLPRPKPWKSRLRRERDQKLTNKYWAELKETDRYSEWSLFQTGFIPKYLFVCLFSKQFLYIPKGRFTDTQVY